MKVSEVLSAIERLAQAQATFLIPRPGYDVTRAYDVRHLHEAANALAKRLVDLPESVDTDDIPF